MLKFSLRCLFLITICIFFFVIVYWFHGNLVVPFYSRKEKKKAPWLESLSNVLRNSVTVFLEMLVPVQQRLPRKISGPKAHNYGKCQPRNFTKSSFIEFSSQSMEGKYISSLLLLDIRICLSVSTCFVKPRIHSILFLQCIFFFLNLLSWCFSILVFISSLWYIFLSCSVLLEDTLNLRKWSLLVLKYVYRTILHYL